MALGNLCSHGWLLGKGKHFIERSARHEAMIMKFDVTEAIQGLLSSELLIQEFSWRKHSTSQTSAIQWQNIST